MVDVLAQRPRRDVEWSGDAFHVGVFGEAREIAPVGFLREGGQSLLERGVVGGELEKETPLTRLGVGHQAARRRRRTHQIRTTRATSAAAPTAVRRPTRETRAMSDSQSAPALNAR